MRFFHRHSIVSLPSSAVPQQPSDSLPSIETTDLPTRVHTKIEKPVTLGSSEGLPEKVAQRAGDLKSTTATAIVANQPSAEPLNRGRSESPLEINIIYKSKYSLLSNFARTPFQMDTESTFIKIGHKVTFGSIEAFVQAIKFPCPGQLVSTGVQTDREHFMKELGMTTLAEYSKYWHQIASLSGNEARHYRNVSQAVRANSDEHDNKYFYFFNQRFEYASDVRLPLIEEALRQKFSQNRLACKQLIETGNAKLKHELPTINLHQTILLPEEFSRLLENLRNEFLDRKK